MFGSLYDDEPDDGLRLDEMPFASASKSYRYRPDNCASLLDMPEKIRDPREFVGLRNQGATCYMNSFIQTLYMIHDFRNAIFKMPLCIGDPLTPSGFLDGQKHQILYSIQKLFVQLKAGAKIAASTIELTDSFGWKNNQQMVQHDVQELIREFLSVLERALKGTPFENLVSDIFYGTKSDILQVPEHGICRARDEKFADIMVQVRACPDLDSSLSSFFNFEFLTGDNQYYCEEVDAKVDALKGVQIRKFPKILTISLLRFDFDYVTLNLKKLNDEFKFPLELHLNQYLTDDSDQKGEEIDYELLSCIIHIGNVGGGHYKAYIRDYANEGTWDFDLYEREEEKKAASKDQGVGTSDDKQPQTEENKPEEKIDYNGDFPIPYKNPELGKNWYEFNDSLVNPIVAGRLESQFGNGSSSQSAYILMYKRKNDQEIVDYEDIPDYWVEEILKQNEAAKAQRAVYDFEANHLEIYLQSQEIFDIEEEKHLKYIDLSETEEQGVKIKIRFDNTIAEIKLRIREALSLAEDCIFDAFEVCKLGNDLCQVFRSISDFDDDIIIKQSQVTHLSTWLVTTDQNIISYLNKIKGTEFEPIYINYRLNETESRVLMYRNMTCGDFIQKTAEIFGFENWKKVKLIFFVDGVMRRLDRLKYDVEKQRDHTLKSLNIKDCSQIVVEEKSEEEIQLEEQNSNMQTDFIDPNAVTQLKTNESNLNVDLTENIRSVLMHKEEDPQFLERFNIDINWTIEELTEKLKQYMGIDKDEERRLRRELDNSLIVKEELSLKLLEYPEFREGGVRLKMEYGRFPSIEELALTVALYSEQSLKLRFYLKKESTILEGKEKICKEFGVDPHKYRLWRTDFHEEPQYIVKKERQHWDKNHIGNGDFLILKSEEDILPDEQVVIDIHETKTGVPNDCKNIGHVTVKDSDTIDELKEAILRMEEYREKPELTSLETDKIRLRMRSRNYFFGKIFRDKNKTLKQLKIKSGEHLVVQFLEVEENLKNNEIVLLLRKRNIKNMDYDEFIEFIYNFDKALPTINHLKSKVSEAIKISQENIAIAKYIPHCYDWKYWNPDEDVPVKSKGGKGGNNKGKKNKDKKKNEKQEEEAKEDKKDNAKEEKQEYSKLAILDLRTTPFLLAEGDILGVRDNSEERATQDDFQTITDIQNRERLEELKKFEKDNKGGKSKPSHNNDPLKILTDF